MSGMSVSVSGVNLSCVNVTEVRAKKHLGQEVT